MKTIPEKLADAGFSLSEIGQAIANSFAGQSGVIFREALAEISPPLCPTIGETDQETYRSIGRAEVVHFILSLSEPEASLTTILTAIYASKTKARTN